MHGEGAWDSSPVAPSWEAFLDAVDLVRLAAIGRETPAALERKPLAQLERDELKGSLRGVLAATPFDFWELLLDSSD